MKKQESYTTGEKRETKAGYEERETRKSGTGGKKQDNARKYGVVKCKRRRVFEYANSFELFSKIFRVLTRLCDDGVLQIV